MGDAQDDAELVGQARAGSRSAFETLVRRHQKALYFLCLRYVRDHDVAADLAQRTFIRVMERLDDLREAGTFRSWLLRIGANLALNHLRDTARFVAEDAALASASAAVAPEAHSLVEAREDAQALRQAVTALPTKQRMTLELRIYENLSFREIAQALDTSEGTAKVNFHYAVRRLRSLMTAHASGKEGKR